MAGVEAAASLFGSEDSGSDLFATLGADDSPAQPPPPEADLFFNTTSTASDAGVFDNIYGDQYAQESGTFMPESEIGASNGQAAVHTNTSEWGQSNDSGAQSEAAFVHSDGASTGVAQQPPSTSYDYGYNNFGGQSQPPNATNAYSDYGYSTSTTSYSSYSAYDPPASKAPPSRSAYDPPLAQPAYQAYDSYKPQVSNGSAYAPYAPSATTVSPYDPPAPTHAVPAHTPSQNGGSLYEPYKQSTTYSPQPTTSPYDPPTQVTRTTSDISTNTYASSVYSPPVAALPPTVPQHNPLTSPPPPPPAVKSTITRPKVSNAYDPPFPATNPRRTARAAIPPQFQSPYQTPLEQYSQPLLPLPQQQPPPPPPPQQQPPPPPLPQHIPPRPPPQQVPPPPPPQQAPPPAPPQRHPPRSNTSYSQYAQDGLNEAFSDMRVTTPPRAQTADVYPSAYPEPPSSEWAMEDMSGDLPVESNSSQYAGEVHMSDPEGDAVPPTSSRPASTKPLSPARAYADLSPASIPLPNSPSPESIPALSHKASSPSPKVIASELEPKKSLPPPRDVKYDPYAPKTAHNGVNNYIPRTSSPLSFPNGTATEAQKPAGPLPRSNLNNSTGPIPKPLNPASFYSNYALDHDVPRQADTKLAPSDNLTRHLGAQYAPSPSLIGANDPLSRTSARAPVISFGFGGKLVTCFHGMPGLNAGFDVAFSSRTSSELKIRPLSKINPELALAPSYPGPLLSDPGTTSISLVRQNAQTQAKTKKASVVSYLADRITELEQGVGYLGSVEKQRTEDKIVLIKLLKAMVESDGRLLGTPQAEAAARSALVPRLESTTTGLQDAVSLQASYVNPPVDDTPVAVTTLRSSSLDRIEELLLQGDRRQAYQYAMTEKLWAHAMIIASSIDKEAWREVAHDFLRTELGTKEDGLSNLSKGTSSQQNTRESLRVAYSLFAGSGAAAVQELVTQSLLQRSLGRLPPPPVPVSATTPRTPNFVQPLNNMYPPVPPELLGKWADTAAMMISSPLSTDYAAALTALGDQLLANNMVEAAHSCYLLSPQTSLVGGLGSPTARMTLVGSKNPAKAGKDRDAIIFSEVFEFAMSLVPVVKGQEPFHGLAQLQVYRFIRAVEIAELGDLQLANRYCDAITACLSHAPSYGNIALLEQLQGLQQRLTGVFHGDKSNSWIGGKISKPSLDSIGGWLEGRFTKLVTGDSEDDAATKENNKAVDQPFVGPFAHYSTISSTTPSARSSPQPPSASLTYAPPQRTASAMATATPYNPQYHVERSSSAMGYSKPRPAVQTSANGNYNGSLASSQSSPVGFGGTSQYNPPATSTSADDESETPVQGSSWWSQSEVPTATPTNATFLKVDESSVTQSDDGFISLMDTNSYSVGPSTPLSMSSRYNHEEDEDDDLGLGNSKPKPPKPETDSSEGAGQEPAKAAAPAADKPAAAPAAAATAPSGWFGRWFKKAETPAPGPIKASLGEENAFYYDKEQKRWVNKKAGSEPPKPAAPPPPPSRAQTASPGMAGPKPATAPTPPPIRPASAADLGEPPKAPMRIRSNLAPPTESAPSTPTGSRMAPGAPPPARPRSQATSKRNIRSRYVDVFQQEGPAA